MSFSQSCSFVLVPCSFAQSSTPRLILWWLLCVFAFSLVRSSSPSHSSISVRKTDELCVHKRAFEPVDGLFTVAGCFTLSAPPCAVRSVSFPVQLEKCGSRTLIDHETHAMSTFRAPPSSSPYKCISAQRMRSTRVSELVVKSCENISVGACFPNS